VSADITPERVLSSRRIHDGRICSLREDTVALANGKTALREIVEHAPVVAIVPIDESGDVVLVRQYRLAAQEALLEVITVERMPLADAVRLVDTGEIKDAKSVAGLLLAASS
jgi:exosome complex RNA-binding protein Csl4